MVSKNGSKAGIVERPAGDVGVDLHAERAVLDGALASAAPASGAPIGASATQPGK